MASNRSSPVFLHLRLFQMGFKSSCSNKGSTGVIHCLVARLVAVKFRMEESDVVSGRGAHGPGFLTDSNCLFFS